MTDTKMIPVTEYELEMTQTYSLTVSSQDEDFVEWCEENDVDPIDATDEQMEEYVNYCLTDDDFCFEEQEVEVTYVNETEVPAE